MMAMDPSSMVGEIQKPGRVSAHRKKVIFRREQDAGYGWMTVNTHLKFDSKLSKSHKLTRQH